MRSVLISSIAAVAVVIVLVAGCDESPQQQGSGGGGSGGSTASNTQATSSTAPATSGMMVAAEATAPKATAVWPPVDASVTLAANLQQMNIVVVYDGSGSMDYDACGASGNRHSNAVPAVKKFVAAVPAEANLGLLVFDTRGTTVRVPLALKNAVTFNAALDNVNIGSGTPLKNAITQAYRVLEKQAQAQLGYGRYVMLIVTDGEASSGQSPTRVVDFMVDKTAIEVHTVGLCISGRHSLNQPGRTFYTDAQNPDQLVAGLTSVLAEATADQVTFD